MRFGSKTVFVDQVFERTKRSEGEGRRHPFSKADTAKDRSRWQHKGKGRHGQDWWT